MKIVRIDPVSSLEFVQRGNSRISYKKKVVKMDTNSLIPDIAVWGSGWSPLSDTKIVPYKIDFQGSAYSVLAAGVLDHKAYVALSPENDELAKEIISTFENGQFP